MKKICIVVSTPMTVNAFLKKHIEYLSTSFKVTVVMNSSICLKKEFGINCSSRNILIDRKINFINDLKSIFKLYQFFKKEKFDLVLSVSPKAGLVSSIASYLAGIKNRIHFFTGQVWVTKKGTFRFILKFIDKLIAKLNTYSLIDSPSQRDFLISENIVLSNNSKVFLSGSISGVDTDKFIFNTNIKNKLIKKYSIKENEIVFMFIGRLNTDKGIFDLVETFEVLLSNYFNIKLFLIGPDEENMIEKISYFTENENVIRLNYVDNPQEILNIADILVLPSYREGFGTIVIEAAAMGIPSIASNIYGLKDAIIDGNTGLLHNKKDIKDMILKYKYAINNMDEIKIFGKNAQERIYKEFKDEYLSRELKKYVEGIL